jgi:hypothetical protein
MKRLSLMIILAVFSIGFVSAEKGKKPADIANEREFSYFFPASSSSKTFSSLDEAYDYISGAQYKLKKAIKLNRAKGLGSRLTGPTISDNQPVVLTYFITATNLSNEIDLSKAGADLEASLKNVITVSCVFMVFYEDRAVSISDFYIKEGYQFNSNAQYTGFKYRGNEYKADYPTGWGLEKAFQYLKKERD